MTFRLVGAAVLLGAGGCSSQDTAPTEHPGLVPLATVRQFGPVGYRDPLGVISPDGQWLATAAHHLLEVRAVQGEAPPRTLPSGEARIVHLTWYPGGRLLV